MQPQVGREAREAETPGFHPEVSGSSPSQALAVSEHLLPEAGSLGSADLLFSTISNPLTRQGFCMQMFWMNTCQSFTSPCPAPLNRSSKVYYVLDLTHLNGLFCLGARGVAILTLGGGAGGLRAVPGTGLLSRLPPPHRALRTMCICRPGAV